MDTDESPQWRQLNVGVIGGGIGQYYFSWSVWFYLPGNQLALLTNLQEDWQPLSPYEGPATESPSMNEQTTQAIQARQ